MICEVHRKQLFLNSLRTNLTYIGCRTPNARMDVSDQLGRIYKQKAVVLWTDQIPDTCTLLQLRIISALTQEPKPWSGKDSGD